jgi:citronellol/citronellal dehydrogenase
MIPGVDAARCRTPEILADAAHLVLTSGVDRFDGRFLIDEELLRGAGVEDFDRYAVDPSKEPLLDLFLDENPDPSEHAR